MCTEVRGPSFRVENTTRRGRLKSWTTVTWRVAECFSVSHLRVPTSQGIPRRGSGALQSTRGLQQCLSWSCLLCSPVMMLALCIHRSRRADNQRQETQGALETGGTKICLAPHVAVQGFSCVVFITYFCYQKIPVGSFLNLIQK